MRDSALPNLSACLGCGYVMERTTNFTGTDAPGPGDVSLCIKCGHLHIFDEHMNMAEPTAEQRAALRSNAEVWRTICRAQLAIAVVNKRGLVVAVARPKEGGGHVGD